MQNHFETDFITIGYDQDIHVVILKWKLAPTSAEFKEGMNSILSAFEHFKTGKLIADTTHMGAIHPDDQEWSTTVWASKAVNVGYSKLALIVSSDIFTKMSVEDTMSMDKTQTPSAYFDTMEAAINWINS